jgi:hypothetical protein
MCVNLIDQDGNFLTDNIGGLLELYGDVPYLTGFKEEIPAHSCLCCVDWNLLEARTGNAFRPSSDMMDIVVSERGGK